MPNKKETTSTGKTVEEAINNACELLGYKREECEWDIIDLPKSSFFGLKKTPAKVKVWITLNEEQQKREQQAGKRFENNDSDRKPAPKKTVEPKQEKKPKVEPKPVIKIKPEAKPVLSIDSTKVVENLSEENKEKEKVSVAYVEEILKNLNMDSSTTVTTKWDSGGLLISIDGKGLGMLIGRKGETLDALQYLASLVANRVGGEYLRVVVDCGDYRDKRNKSLEEMAVKAAEQVTRTNISKALEPMNAAERRIVHSKISEIDGVSSISVGSDPYRKVVIKTPTSKNSSNRGGRKPREGGYKGNGGNNKRNYDKKPPRTETPVDTVPNDTPKIDKKEAGETPLYGKIEL